MKNLGAGSKWLPGKIVETSGLVSFHVLLEDGRHKRCHQDQLRPRVVGNRPPHMSLIPLDEDVPISVPIAAELDVETPLWQQHQIKDQVHHEFVSKHSCLLEQHHPIPICTDIHVIKESLK